MVSESGHFALLLMDCTEHIEEDRSLNAKVYRTPTHTDQHLLFDYHNPLQLGVIRTLQLRAQTVQTH